MQVILYEPQIPQNTGNIVRTCSLTNSQLCLVEPLGFSTSSKMLKRAGLDYWESCEVQIIKDLASFLESQSQNFYFFSSKSERPYSDIQYEKDDLLIFGSETHGLDPYFFQTYPKRFATIPMKQGGGRCLNLSNAVAIVLYEAQRQQAFSFGD